MEVNSLSNHSFISNSINISKAGKSESVPESAEHETIPDSDDFAISDKVSINKSQYGNEAQFAHRVLDKLNQATTSDLANFKSKIDQGSYQSESVRQTVVSRIKDSLR